MNAQGKVTWKSSNKSVAAVKNGKVTAKKKGTAKITATVRGKKLTCKVTVKAKTGKETGAKAKYSGSYLKVGTDIPAGTYVLMAKGKDLSTYTISKDADGQSTVSSGSFFGNMYMKLTKGQYLNMESCYTVPEKQAKPDTKKSGVFKVGKDVTAGTHKLVSTAVAGGEGRYHVYSSLNALMTDEVEIGDMKEIEGSMSVTLKKGQYLQTIDCRFE